MILTLSCITCLTEMSTPFVSMRALLYQHKKSSSTLYLINGLTMTISFGIFRCCFQTWLVTTRLVPAVLDRSNAMLSDSTTIVHASMWFSLCMYVTLCAMNFYWFSLMVRGLVKALLKPKTKKEEKVEKED